MNYEHRTGDIFASGADALVVPTNCRGVQGAGLADYARQMCRAWSLGYRQACREGAIRPGSVWAHRTPGGGWLIALATKDDWRAMSRPEWVEAGLDALVRKLDDLSPTPRTVAIPALGCGLGGLRWEDVRPLIEAAAGRMLGARVLIYGPGGGPG